MPTLADLIEVWLREKGFSRIEGPHLEWNCQWSWHISGFSYPVTCIIAHNEQVFVRACLPRQQGWSLHPSDPNFFDELEKRLRELLEAPENDPS